MDSRFNSQKQTHWPRYVLFSYRRTSNKPKPTSARPFDVVFNDSYFAELQCPCGAGPCIILTSHTEKNPGRKFYKCLLNRSQSKPPDTWQIKSLSSMIEKALKASLLTSQAEIHHQQTQLWRLISTTGATSSKDPIHQILDLHVRGWLGQRAFPPPRCQVFL